MGFKNSTEMNLDLISKQKYDSQIIVRFLPYNPELTFFQIIICKLSWNGQITVENMTFQSQ